ncbi:BBE domain-containing protein [Nonomuraea wenchangensis]
MVIPAAEPLTDTGRTAAAWSGADHARLREVQRACDPDGFFRVGHVVER